MLYRQFLKTKPKDVDEQSGLNCTWSETPKSGFLLQELKTAVPLYSLCESDISVNKIKKTEHVYQFICRIGHYTLHFKFHFFVVSLLVSRNKMVKF